MLANSTVDPTKVNVADLFTMLDMLTMYKGILLNGRGDVSTFNHSIKHEVKPKPLWNVTFQKPQPGKACKKYLLRVINTSFDTTFVFSIDNHLLQVVSSDFVPITPYRNTSILVGIGQRYNVIVEANPLSTESPLDPYGNYWIRTQIATCFRGSNQGDPGYDQIAILRYDEHSHHEPATKKWNDISLACSDETYTSLHPIVPWTVEAPANGNLNSHAPKFGQDFAVALSRTSTPKDYPVALFTIDDTGKKIPMRVNYSDPIFLHLDPKDPVQQNPPDLWRVVPENYTNSEWVSFLTNCAFTQTFARPGNKS